MNLYWRILYAARGAIDASRASYSLDDEIVSWPVAIVCFKHIKPDEGCRSGGEPGSPFVKGVMAVISLADVALRSFGETPHHIPIGATGAYKGIRVRVDRYGSYGDIVLGTDDRQTDAERFDAWKRLGEINGFASAVEPRDLNPTDFTSL